MTFTRFGGSETIHCLFRPLSRAVFVPLSLWLRHQFRQTLFRWSHHLNGPGSCFPITAPPWTIHDSMTSQNATSRPHGEARHIIHGLNNHPILTLDPHLPFRTPSMYQLNHVQNTAILWPWSIDVDRYPGIPLFFWGNLQESWYLNSHPPSQPGGSSLIFWGLASHVCWSWLIFQTHWNIQWYLR